jgi:hypothetical protein
MVPKARIKREMVYLGDQSFSSALSAEAKQMRPVGNCPENGGWRRADDGQEMPTDRMSRLATVRTTHIVRTVWPPDASEKNHNGLRLVSGSEYRMAAIRIELCWHVSFWQLTRE